MAYAVLTIPSTRHSRKDTASAAGSAHTARRARSRAISISGSPPAAGVTAASVELSAMATAPDSLGVVLVHLAGVAVVDLDDRPHEAEHSRHDGEDRGRSQPPIRGEADQGQDEGAQHK